MNDLENNLENKTKKTSKIPKPIWIIIIIVLAFFVVKTNLKFASEVVKSNNNNDPQTIYTKVLANAQSKYPGINVEEFKQGYQQGLIDGESDSKPSTIIADPINSYKLGFSYGYPISCIKLHPNDQTICQDRLLGK